MALGATDSPAVRAEGVRKSFGATVALAGVSLEIGEGSVYGLLGPNGAGKTTLVRILATLLSLDAGEAEVFGLSVVRDPSAVRELIGLTGQFAAVDEVLTGRENLEMFGRLFHLEPAEATRRARDLLERFDLADAADRPARTYSGGMRRRLDLASSLIGSPRMVFLDEPTTGLDPRSRNEVWTAVRQLVRDGTTVLLTTQYLEEADQLADRIAVIDHGRLIAEGTSDQLKDRLGGQVLEVRLAQPGEREQARAALAGVGCGNPQPSERQDELTMAASRGGVELVTDAAAALRERGIAVNDLALRRPTLDDVFLELTGNPPSEDGAGSDDADGRALADRAGPERLDGAAGPDGAARPDGAGAAVAARGGPAVAARASSAVAARASSAVAADTAHPRARPGRWRQAVQHDRLALRRTVADTWIVTRRNLLHFVRQPQLLIFSTVQPIMFVLLFVYVFGGAIKGSLPHGVPYVDFLLPGIFVQSVAFRATQTAVGLSEDLERGVVDRFRSMPMARSAVLAGRTVADLVRNVLIIGLMVLVGYVIGFRFRGTVPDVIGCVLVVSAFGLALSWIFAFVALTVRGAEAAQSAGFVAIFPLVFASSVFVPVSSMPAWLAAFAKVSPVTLTADAARAFALGGSTSGSLPGALAWAGGLLAVFIPLCVWRYRRIS